MAAKRKGISNVSLAAVGVTTADPELKMLADKLNEVIATVNAL